MFDFMDNSLHFMVVCLDFGSESGTEKETLYEKNDEFLEINSSSIVILLEYAWRVRFSRNIFSTDFTPLHTLDCFSQTLPLLAVVFF